MSARQSNNNNSAGVGGFADRPWDRWRVGDPGRAICDARSKRTGLPCSRQPMEGSLRCYLHGGRSKGRGKRTAAFRFLRNRPFRGEPMSEQSLAEKAGRGYKHRNRQTDRSESTNEKFQCRKNGPSKGLWRSERGAYRLAP